MTLNWIDILFISSFLIQSTIWGLLFRLPTRSKLRQQKNTQRVPVTIVVCAHNECDNLKKLIPELLNQNYPDFEIIIVNDRSTDDTLDLLATYSQGKIKTITIKNTPENFNHKKHALQQGIEAAKHDYILVTDADCMPHSSFWISEMISSLPTKKGIVLGMSPYFPLSSSPILNQIIQFETAITALNMSSFTLAGFPYMGLGRNMLYHKSIFLNSPITTTFKHTTGGDDDLLVNYMGTESNTSICFSPESLVFSYPKKTIKSWFHQKRRHLQASSFYSIKSKILLSIINVSHGFFIFSLIIQQYLTLPTYFIIVAYLLRTYLLFVIFDRICRKLKSRTNLMFIIIGDFVYPFYLFTLGILSIVFKTNTWK